MIYVLAGVKGTTYRLRSAVVGEGIKRKKRGRQIRYDWYLEGVSTLECWIATVS